MGLERYGCFFALLRAALHPGDGPFCPGGADWQFIYDTAVRHCVQGVMYDAVKDLPAGSGVSPVLAAGWLSDALQAERDYARIREVSGRLAALWKAAGVDAQVLKGLECARFYPVPEHRINGDIDWWMRGEESWNRALEVLKDKGIQWSVDSDGDLCYEVDGVVVEHHRSGFVEDSPEAELLFLAEHVFHHAAVSGVGLRQLCDYAMALERLEGKYDREHYLALASSAGLSGWVRLLESALSVVREVDCPPCCLGSRVRTLLELVMDDGNFGLGRGKRFRYIFRRLYAVGLSAPVRFAGRWVGLAVGRIKRIV